MRRPIRHVLLAALVGAMGLFPSPARAGELVYCDGRRREAKDPRVDAKGAWTAEIEGRRILLVPGEVVVVVDDKGKEAVLQAHLGEGPRTAADEALLVQLRDPKNDGWRASAEALAAHPTRGVLEALVELAADRNKALRGRAIAALARLRVKESVAAAAEAVLAEKDKAARADSASVLFSVQEIYRRLELEALTARGLEDKDAKVRVVFALLAPRSLEAAADVLRKDGIGSSDHHVRESAAVELGLRGDGTGEKVLIGMLARSRIPGLDDSDTSRRMLADEQVRVCEALGRIKTKTALDALRRAEGSPHPAVKAAAAKALAAATAD